MLIKVASCFAVAAVAAFVVYGYRIGMFSSVDTFRKFIDSFGVSSGIVFMAVQAVQVVVPVLSTSGGCVAGILAFGPWLGFLYNYIGICAGSAAAFFLSKKYGSVFVEGIIGKKPYKKYIGLVNEGAKFDKLFAIAIFLPVVPDDILCYIAGLTKMSPKKFIAIILLGKPVSISLYSIGLTAALHYLSAWIK